MEDIKSFNIDQPRWPQTTFLGRLKHYANITDPRNALVNEAGLNEAKELVLKHRNGQVPPGTTLEQLHKAQSLYMSAFHPDTGDKQNVVGRMSFQVPGGMTLIGCMLQFYKTNYSIFFWQWANQSFNAFVNYTNRNAQTKVKNSDIAIAYVSATTSALVAAIYLKKLLLHRASPFFQRYVPFAAVAAANCVNIPLMRQGELKEGITIFDQNNNKVGVSKLAAVTGISQVILSRIIICAPSMLLLPIVTERLERKQWWRRLAMLHAPFQVLLSGAMLVFMVPIGCALFQQYRPIQLEKLKKWEPKEYEAIKKKHPDLEEAFYNKGL